ncbi:hypothetical protein SETIT_6G004400v2 [Setaria italica]|uniref:Secreted protein n=1 Tax=Setaria italica TaxID=4555 RepID=A0A368RGS1_SETIT|nr:hypothetical protein SETIT_6G004400v2 [Setaria italica]
MQMILITWLSISLSKANLRLATLTQHRDAFCTRSNGKEKIDARGQIQGRGHCKEKELEVSEPTTTNCLSPITNCSRLGLKELLEVKTSEQKALHNRIVDLFRFGIRPGRSRD